MHSPFHSFFEQQRISIGASDMELPAAASMLLVILAALQGLAAAGEFIPAH
jgi:hypothetical protein